MYAVWAFVAAILVGVALFLMAAGLPAQPALHFWSGGPELALSTPVAEGAALLAAIITFGLLLVIWAAWVAAKRLGLLVGLLAGIPVPESSITALVAVFLVVLLVSAATGSAILIRGLLLIGLVLTAAVVGRRLVELLRGGRRFTVRNSATGLAGGQGGWELSEPLGLIVLAAILLGAAVGLAQVDRARDPPPAPPVATRTATPESQRTATPTPQPETQPGASATPEAGKH